MKLDAVIMGVPVREAQTFAREVEACGLDGLWFTESGRTAYLGCTAAALATERITIGTGIAVAFPRSPFVTAGIAWELAEASAGRFVLGLGTQVRAHIERRYASEFSPPGPRLQEYMAAVRAVWHAFQTGEPLRFEGEYWPMTIGSLGAWTAGPIEYPDVPIYIAGVRPWMLRMAGASADGLHVHPFHSTRYLTEVIQPEIRAGADAAGRNPSAVELVCPLFTIVGDTDAERYAWRERARFQIAFYGSTRTYRGVFELHGWPGVAEALHERQRAGDIAGMAKLITDEMLDVYAIESNWDELADRIVERYRGLADRIILYFSGPGWRDDPGVMAQWEAVAKRFAAHQT